MKTTEPTHWRSLEERANTESYRERAEKEFAEYVEQPELDGATRRHFLGVMGATLAMGSLSGCDFVRRPVQHIVPYTRRPEDLLPGTAQRYATVTQVGGRAIGLLAEAHEGRPTKLEGNPEHPSTPGGGLLGMHQGMVLELYDPKRLRKPLKGTAEAKWEDVEAAVKALFEGHKASPGKGVAVLSEAIPSPTLDALRDRFLKTFQGSKWFTYEPLADDNERAGLAAFFGKPLRPVYSLDKATRVLALDSDFLGFEGDAVANAWKWAQTRKLEKPGDQMGRLYAVEPVLSVTGGSADHRLRLAAAQVEAFAFAVVAAAKKRNAALPGELAGAAGERSKGLSEAALKFADAVAEDLFAQGNTGAVVAGRRQPPIVHAVAAALNQALQGAGATVTYYRDMSRLEGEAGDLAGLTQLVGMLDGGQVDTIVVLGGNPVAGAPADLDLKAALGKAKTSIYLGTHADETSQAATWTIPRAHFLEAWGDMVFSNGVAAIQQPLIEPLHGAWSEIELLARALGDKATDGRALVHGFWLETFKRWNSFADAGFAKAWRKWLHDGRITRTLFGPVPSHEIREQRSVASLLGAAPAAAPSDAAMEVIFDGDPYIHDGRFANNSWLLEAPDPVTKLTWDNVAAMSYTTANRLGVLPHEGNKTAQMVNLKLGDKTLKIPAWVVPGMADNVVALNLGYGRDFGNFLPYHPQGVVGFDVRPVRTAGAAWIAAGATVSGTGEHYDTASVQVYGQQRPTMDTQGYERQADAEASYDPRALVRETSWDKFQENPKFAQPGIIHHGKAPPKALVIHPPAKSTYGDWDYTKGGDDTKRDFPYAKAEYQWGMTIDLNACTGCNACLVACVAENNIMSVGKDQVRRGRDMHWMRIDRYYTGTVEDAQVVHQPLNCQHCETAPCENVCPVTATSHSPEGLNDMAYNRCVGTRYCMNNCPFKVRRFNYYNFSKGQDTLYQMARNPNVTVRFRGVVEKCTYCVQRINIGKRNANLAANPKAARAAINEIVTACQQTCPTGAITFGDIWDPESAVGKAKAQDRNYGLLSELNLHPRTTYLAKVRNPNPKMGG